jgi:hypothetical protein
MNEAAWDETLVPTEVTYILEIDGAIVVIEGVPARLNAETGERYFSPETVEQLHQIVHSNQSPERIIQAPVFRFAA